MNAAKAIQDSLNWRKSLDENLIAWWAMTRALQGLNESMLELVELVVDRELERRRELR